MNTATLETSSSVSTRGFNTIVFLALIIAMVGPFASDSYLPSLPAMTQALGTTSHTVQLTITIYLFGFALSQLIYGPMSDKHGRRLLVLAGLGICVLGSFVCAMAPTIGILLFGRLLQGIGAGATNSLFRAIMRDVVSGARMAKIISYIGMGFAIAPAIAPILGGYIQHALGWRANYIFLFILISAVWLLIWYLFPETNQQRNPHATKLKVVTQNYKALLTNKLFMGFTLCSSLAYAGMIAYLTVSPFLFQTVLGLTPVEYGWLALAITAGLVIGQFLNGLLVGFFDSHKMLLAGIIIMLLSGVGMLTIGLLGILNIPAIIIPTILFIIAAAFVFANAMAGALHPFANMAGAAGALYGCLQILGSFISSLLIASFHSNNQLIIANTFIGISLLSMVIFVSCLYKNSTERAG